MGSYSTLEYLSSFEEKLGLVESLASFIDQKIFFFSKKKNSLEHLRFQYKMAASKPTKREIKENPLFSDQLSS